MEQAKKSIIFFLLLQIPLIGSSQITKQISEDGIIAKWIKASVNVSTSTTNFDSVWKRDLKYYDSVVQHPEEATGTTIYLRPRRVSIAKPRGLAGLTGSL
jgi:hypothetical protein